MRFVSRYENFDHHTPWPKIKTGPVGTTAQVATRLRRHSHYNLINDKAKATFNILINITNVRSIVLIRQKSLDCLSFRFILWFLFRN